MTEQAQNLIAKLVRTGQTREIVRAMLEAGAGPREIIEAAVPKVEPFPSEGDNFKTVGVMVR